VAHRNKIAVLGGTFDPIHLGHLRSALEIYQALAIDELRFIPCRMPVHKQQVSASTKDRVAMLKLAIAGQKGFLLDEREIQRDSASYMHTTLQSLREENPAASLMLIVGADAFVFFHTWHRYAEILDLAHLVVIERANIVQPYSNELRELVAQRATNNKDTLEERVAGNIFFTKTTSLDISATMIRALIANQQSPRYLLQYIQENDLYK